MTKTYRRAKIIWARKKHTMKRNQMKREKSNGMYILGAASMITVGIFIRYYLCRCSVSGINRKKKCGGKKS